MAKQDVVDRAFVPRGGNQNAIELAEHHTFEPQDDNFYIVDGTDKTKRFRFVASGITAATTRSYTLPDGDLNLGTGAGVRRNVLSGEASLALTAAMSGSLILLDDATQAFVLPVASAATVGVFWDFQSTVAATTTTFTATTPDLYTGGVCTVSASVPAADHFQPDVTDDLILTLNGGTQGGMIGTKLRITCSAADRWLVEGVLLGTGTVITPFS